MAKILIADDDPILVELLKFRLEGAGYTVEDASDGKQVLEKVEKAAPDLIVLDMMMPVMSGVEALRTLKADKKNQRIPVVMLTARSGEDDIVSTLKAGADEYLTKPFIPQELLVRIDGLLKRRD